MAHTASLVIDGVVFPCWVKEQEFKSGSVGLTIGCKAQMEQLPVQFTGNVVVIGSSPKSIEKKTARVQAQLTKLEAQMEELRAKNNIMPSGGTAEQIAKLSERMTRATIDASNE